MRMQTHRQARHGRACVHVTPCGGCTRSHKQTCIKCITCRAAAGGGLASAATMRPANPKTPFSYRPRRTSHPIRKSEKTIFYFFKRRHHSHRACDPPTAGHDRPIRAVLGPCGRTMPIDRCTGWIQAHIALCGVSILSTPLPPSPPPPSWTKPRFHQRKTAGRRLTVSRFKALYRSPQPTIRDLGALAQVAAPTKGQQTTRQRQRTTRAPNCHRGLTLPQRHGAPRIRAFLSAKR